MDVEYNSTAEAPVVPWYSNLAGDLNGPQADIVFRMRSRSSAVRVQAYDTGPPTGEAQAFIYMALLRTEGAPALRACRACCGWHRKCHHLREIFRFGVARCVFRTILTGLICLNVTRCSARR